MPHARLSELSRDHAKAVGLAMAELHKLRTLGLPAPAMIALGSLEGHLSKVSDINAEIGPLAGSVSADDATDPVGGAKDGSKGSKASA